MTVASLLIKYATAFLVNVVTDPNVTVVAAVVAVAAVASVAVVAAVAPVTLVDVAVVPVNKADVGHCCKARHARAHATMN